MASSSLPLDLISDGILPRVPVKSLLRFKSVSKSWYALISDPNFRLSSPLRRRIMVTDSEMGPVSLTNVTGTRKLSIPSFPLWARWYSALVCDDLLCVEDSGQIYIWNPTTRKFKDLPCDPERTKVVMGFGRVAATGSLKILFLMDSDTAVRKPDYILLERQHRAGDYYVLGGGRDVPYKVAHPPYPLYYQGATVDGIVYSYAIKRPSPMTCIVRFDLEKEEWLPELALPPKLKRIPGLHNLNGSLCLVSSNNFIMWVLIEGGWVEHLIQSPAMTSVSGWKGLKPMAVMEDGRIMIRLTGDFILRFFLYDPEGCKEVQEITQDHHRELPTSISYTRTSSLMYTEGLTSSDILLGSSSPKRRRRHELLPCSSQKRRKFLEEEDE